MSLKKFGVPTVNSDATIVLMPKLQYRFSIDFINFGTGLGTSDYDQLSRNVTNISKPTMQHDEVTLDVYNSKIFMAGKHTWTPINVTFRDDVNNKTSAALNSQINRQVNHLEQSAPAAAAAYKFKLSIRSLTGENTGVAGTHTLDRWDLFGCYIDNINYNEAAYNTSEPMTISISVKYDNAIYNYEDFVQPDPSLATS
jgi:hypothetical protein